MTIDNDLLLLKQYVLNTYPKELEYVSATVIEADLKGFLTNSMDKADFYKGQETCLEQILSEYRAINEEKNQCLLDFLSKKQRLWANYPYRIQNKSIPYQEGFQQRLGICQSLITGLQGFLLDDGPLGGSTTEYVHTLKKADKFAEDQLASLLTDMGFSLKELRQYRVPFWQEYISVFCLNMREIYFFIPDLECNPTPIIQKEILRLKESDSTFALSALVEEKLQNVINEQNSLIDQLNS